MLSVKVRLLLPCCSLTCFEYLAAGAELVLPYPKSRMSGIAFLGSAVPNRMQYADLPQIVVLK